MFFFISSVVRNLAKETPRRREVANRNLKLFQLKDKSRVVIIVDYSRDYTVVNSV